MKTLFPRGADAAPLPGRSEFARGPSPNSAPRSAPGPQPRLGSSRSLLAALLGLLALSACDAEFDPGSQVSSLRVLAVRADTPFVHPGDTVRLQALSHDPEGRALSWA